MSSSNSTLIAESPQKMPAWDGKPPLEIPLWPGNPPGMVAGAGPGADDGTGRIRNVGIPGLLVHLPEKGGTNRRVLVFCPGGAYSKLAATAIGNGVLAPFLADDFVVVILKYRLSPPSLNVEADSLADARRAVRTVRHRAAEWGIDPKQVGMIGWSAGGNLTLNLVSHPDAPDPASTDPVERESSRPDFVAMLCPWPNGRDIAEYPIPQNAPPAFIASARDDTTAPTAFAEAIVKGYKKAEVPCTFWQIDTGNHTAFSWNSTGEGRQWRTHFLEWLERVPR